MDLSPAGGHRLRSRRWRCAALWLLVASLASPAAAATKWSLWSRLFGKLARGAPPWAAEAPGAAGSRFGLGLDLFFERQESLRIDFMEQSLRARDLLTGREESGTVRTDPGLLNRKFDLRWDLTGAGTQPAIALPSLGLPWAQRLYPTLVLQAASVDVGLDFHDRNRPSDSSSLDGRGSLFGAGLDLTTSLCRGCPWFAGASYGFQKVPSFTVGQSPRFGPPGFEVLEDEARLRRDVQEASTRVGYGFSDHRVVSYLGVRHRWTDLEIEDHLRYRDPFGEVETALASRTTLESEVTLALAGVEAQLGPRLFSRVETSVGEGDWGVLFRVVYLPPGAGGERWWPPDLAARLARILAEFLEGRGQVARESGVTQIVVATRLLDHTEASLLEVFAGPDFAAMRDYVKDRFQRARERLQADAVGTLEMKSPRLVPAVLGSAFDTGIRTARQEGGDAKGALDFIQGFLDKLGVRARNDDWKVNVCVKSRPLRGVLVRLQPQSYSSGYKKVNSTDDLLEGVPRGLYVYMVRQGVVTIDCRPQAQPPQRPPHECDGLDFFDFDRPLVNCDLNMRECWVDEARQGQRCKDER